MTLRMRAFQDLPVDSLLYCEISLLFIHIQVSTQDSLLLRYSSGVLPKEFGGFFSSLNHSVNVNVDNKYISMLFQYFGDRLSILSPLPV